MFLNAISIFISWTPALRNVRLLVGLFVMLACLQVQAASVFILHSYSQEYNWTRRQHASFVQRVESQAKSDVLISTEYLDTKRHAYNDDYAQELYRHLQIKYAGYHPDLIYVTDDNALGFARAYLTSLFPDVPVVFSGVNNYSMLNKIDPKLMTGVFEKKEITPNIDIIKHVGARRETMAFIGDASNTYHAIEHEINTELTKYPDITAKFISSDVIDDIVTGLGQCGCKYVFLTTIGGIKDGSGKSLSLKEIIRRITETDQFALLSMEDGYLYDGVVGGYVTSGEGQGEAAADIALKILSGTPVSDLHPVLKSPNKYIFDQRELKRLALFCQKIFFRLLIYFILI
jgi:hypothetical protein